MSTLLLLSAADPRRREAISRQRRHRVAEIVGHDGPVLLHSRHRSQVFVPCASRSSDALLPSLEVSTPRPIEMGDSVIEKDLSTLIYALNRFARSYIVIVFKVWKHFMAERRRHIQRRCVSGLYARKLKIAYRTWLAFVLATKREAVMKHVLKRLENRKLLLAWLTWRAHYELMLRGEALNQIARLSHLGKLWTAFEHLKEERKVPEEPNEPIKPTEIILELPTRPLRSHCNCVHRLR
jgi:hypothetical protein